MVEGWEGKGGKQGTINVFFKKSEKLQPISLTKRKFQKKKNNQNQNQETQNLKTIHTHDT